MTMLAVLASNGSAQSATGRIFRGTVREVGTQAPVPRVSVQLVDRLGQDVALSITDSGGRFRLDAPEPGTYRVRATKIGFLRAESPFVHADTAGALVVELSRVALLDSVIVTAEAVMRPTQQLIRGRLVDDDSGEPLENGTIALIDDRNRQVATVTTSRDGTFRLVSPAPGTYSMLGRHVGHKPALQEEFPLRLGDTVGIEFRLSRVATLLAPALVTASAKPWHSAGERRGLADLEDRIRRFDNRRHAQFILRDTIDLFDRRAFDIDRMIDRVVKTTPNGISCRGTTYVVDNAIWPTPEYGDSVSDQFPLGTLELLEVYTYPDIPTEFSAPIYRPGERSAMVPPCRAISIWTRLNGKRR